MGNDFLGSAFNAPDGNVVRGTFTAMDMRTNTVAWQKQWTDSCYSGSVTTAGGLVFVGHNDGRLIETVCVESYRDGTVQGELRLLKSVAAAITDMRGKGVLIVDDLVDTGKTAKVVRELLPGAHFATVYAKPMGRPLVDTFITEVSQDTWIYFPWDTGLAFQPPIREGGA